MKRYEPKLYRLLYLPAGDYVRVPRFPWDPCNGNAFKPYELERHHIEGRPAEVIASNLASAYEEFC